MGKNTLIRVSETGEAIADTAGRIFAEHCGSHKLLEAEGGWAPDLWQELLEAGISGALQPAGSDLGIDPVDALNIIALGGKYAAPVPLAETMLAQWLSLTAGLPENEGAVTIAGAHRRDRIAFSRTNNCWRVSGWAFSVPWARYCDRLLTFGLVDGELHIAMVAADKVRITNGDNIARESRDKVEFDSVFEGAVIRFERPMSYVRMLGASVRVLQMAGALDELLELTAEYVSTRSQFGRPLSKFQTVQQNVALLGGQIAAARAAANSVARAFGEQEAYYAVAAAKCRVGEAVGLATQLAHQAHGAIGITQEYRLQFLSKRLWAWRDEFGTEAEWSRILGSEVLSRGASDLWPFVAAGLRTRQDEAAPQVVSRAALAAE